MKYIFNGNIVDEDNNNIQFAALVNMSQSALYNFNKLEFRVLTDGKTISGNQITSILDDVNLASLNLNGVSEQNKEWE